jgi:septum formation protein
LCSDTTVALGRRIYGKPLDAADAASTLQQLSGRTHQVITAVAFSACAVGLASVRHGVGVGSGMALGSPTAAAAAGSDSLFLQGHQAQTAMAVSTSHVSFAELTADAIARYVEGGEPFGKAGAYAIQGRAGAWVIRIDGSYTGIMGLPLYETAVLLRAAGLRC